MTSKTEKAAADVARIEHDLAEAEASLATLEGERGKVGLAGDAEAVDSYHIELFKAEGAVRTFQAALDTAKAAQATAAAHERKKALEAKAKAVGTDTVAALIDARQEALMALEYTRAVLLEMGELKREINAFNQQVARADRPDLTVRVEEAVVTVATPRPPSLDRELKETDEAYAERQKAADAAWAEQKAHAERECEPLESDEDFQRRQAEAVRKVKRQRFEAASSLAQRRSVAKASVKRLGETDKAYALRRAGARLGVHQNKNESDAGFELRVANAQHRQQRLGETGDPLRHAGEQAITAIQEFALGMDAYSRNRNFPKPFDPRAHIAADGKQIQRPHLLPDMKNRLRPVAELPQQRPAPGPTPKLPAQKLPRWR